MVNETASLQNALNAIMARLSSLESKVGITSASPAPLASAQVAVVEDDEIAPALTAYDEHMKNAATDFVKACSAIEGLKDTGSHVNKIWVGIRAVVEIGTKCKKPSDVQKSLMPFLKPVQDAIGEIRKARLDRKFDWHIKALMEMLNCASWVVMSAPPAPSTFIKDTVGSSDYWANKIRKEYKGKDDAQIAFCDTMKALIMDLSKYVREYHLSGLMWNPRGIAIEDFKPSESSGSAPKPSRPAMPAAGDMMKELASKRTSDGSSAATGLKKVSRDQQTWRKEFNADKAAPVLTNVKPSQVKAAEKPNTQKKRGKPVCKFQNIGAKWNVENQTRESNPGGICVVEVKNPKEQVYIYNCENATIQIKGKLKSVVLDKCVKSNLVFESAISSCEVVNCKRVQIQCTGLCPSIAIDKTDGCLTYLSAEGVASTNFVTSKSSEMNVSWQDEKSGEMKEAPIPEQFIHRLVDGSITSDVSDIYH